MIEPPQFRTVLRGADPVQVAAAIKALHASLDVTRRTVADRTIELSRIQGQYLALEAALATAQQRIVELEQQRPAPGSDYRDVGSLIASMLTLAEEEAVEIRAAAVAEMAEERERATRQLAAERTAEQSRLDEVRVRTARLVDEVSETRAHGDAENERRLMEAEEGANGIKGQAREEAARMMTSATAAAHDIFLRASAEAQQVQDESQAVRGQVESIRARAAADSQRQLAGAHQEADRILEDARARASHFQEAARRGAADAITERDRIHRHIQEILELLQALDVVLQKVEDPVSVA